MRAHGGGGTRIGRHGWSAGLRGDHVRPRRQRRAVSDPSINQTFTVARRRAVSLILGFQNIGDRGSGRWVTIGHPL